jgi:hypothetical protein
VNVTSQKANALAMKDDIADVKAAIIRWIILMNLLAFAINTYALMFLLNRAFP